MKEKDRMSTKHERMQKMIRYYKRQTGKHEVDMHDVAKFAVQKGWTLPKPPDPLDLLASQFSQAAREEIKVDKKTGRPYRVNHAYPRMLNNQQVFFWLDIDDPKTPRPKMLKSAVNRREQMVGDGLQLTLDLDHWNSIHPKQEPNMLDMDLTDDIKWRKAVPGEKEEVA